MAPKVVLVTGCSAGGIGFSLCEQFAKRSCKVYATSRNVETMIGFSDSNIERMSLDVTSDDDVQRVVRDILEIEGRIDVVVNNAGILAIGPLIDLSMEQVQRTFDTNTYSLLRVAKAVIPSMAKRKSGLIVNIGSVVAEIPTPWNGLYSASKAAFHTLSDVLAMECKPFNIDVMLVAPAAVSSNISKNHAATYYLPSDSLYTAFAENIMERMYISQRQAPMPTDVFAKKVVTKALKAKPPVYLMIGGRVMAFILLKWLPKPWVLSLMWKFFSKKH